MPEDNQTQESTFKNNRNEPEKEEVVWIAPSRPFKRRDKKFYVTTFAMAAVVGLVLFLVEGWVPVVLIISLVFLFYVMSTVPPEDVEYKITNKGIKIAGRRTDWEALGRFWFTKRFDTDLLMIETFTIPGKLELVVDPNKKGEIENAVSKYLNHEEIPPNSLDKATAWLSGKLPQ